MAVDTALGIGTAVVAPAAAGFLALIVARAPSGEPVHALWHGFRSHWGQLRPSFSLALTPNGTVTAAWYEAYQGGPLDAASWRAGTRFAHPYAIAQTCDTNGIYEGQTPLEPIAPGRILILTGDCSQPTAEGTDAVIGTRTSFSPPTFVFPSTPPYGTTVASDGRGQAILASVNGDVSAVTGRI
jgi:hypothetical protein